MCSHCYVVEYHMACVDLLSFCALLPLLVVSLTYCKKGTWVTSIRLVCGLVCGALSWNVRGPSLLWVVLSLNRWARAVQEIQGKQARKPSVLCGLCFSCLLPWLPPVMRVWPESRWNKCCLLQLLLVMVFCSPLSQQRKETDMFTTLSGTLMYNFSSVAFLSGLSLIRWV